MARRPLLLAALAAAVLSSRAPSQLVVLDPHRIWDAGFENAFLNITGNLPELTTIGLQQTYPPTFYNPELIAAYQHVINWDSVSGYTADGVTSLIVGYKAPEPGCVLFTIVDDPTSFVAAPESSVGVLRDMTAKQSTGNPLFMYTQLYAVPKGKGYVFENWAFAELRAPENFDRDSNDNMLQRRYIEVEARFHKLDDCATQLDCIEDFHIMDLYRPPVIMVHGLFSSPAMWHEVAWDDFTQAAGYAFTRDLIKADYSRTLPVPPGFGDPIQENAASFSVNQDVVPKAIAKAVGQRRQAAIACTKADVIGHSMGGLLARIYASNDHAYTFGQTSSYKTYRPDNWNLGDVHKLVTMDTPHRGSEWADLLMYLGYEFLGGELHGVMDKVGTALGNPPFHGAVSDMQTDSPEILGLLPTPVPSHAISSTGGRTVTSQPGQVVVDFLEDSWWWVWALPDVVQWAIVLAGGASIGIDWFVDSYVFNGQEHDLIVNAASMRGGLGGGDLSEQGSPPWEMTHVSMGSVPALCGGTIPCWVGNGSSPTWEMEFQQLLWDRVDAGRFASQFPAWGGALEPPQPPGGRGGPVADWPGAGGPAGGPPSAPATTGGGGLGGPPVVPPPQGAMAMPIQPKPLFGLKIVSPANGTNVTAGAPLTVTVRPINGFDPDWVLVVIEGDLAEATPVAGTDDWTAQVTPALEAIGALEVTAVATNAQDVLVEAPSKTVDVVPPAGAFLTGLTIEPLVVDVFAFDPETQLRVVGHYTDVDRDVSAAATGTTYQVLDPAVATVSAGGRVSAQAIGLTSVVATNAGYSDSAAVNVHEIKGDADSDGDVDLSDFGAFGGCFTGPIEDAGYLTTGNTCLHRFDFDGDHDVDLDDFDAFLLVYTGPVGLDCNGNGTDDMLDIVSGTLSDCDRDGVPDACSPQDCNGNGIADACDIAPSSFGFDLSSWGTTSTLPPGDVAVGDFDGDGDGDIAACQPATEGFSVLLGASGGWGQAVGNTAGNVNHLAIALASGDLDGAGADELVVLLDDPNNATGDRVVVMRDCSPVGIFPAGTMYGLSGGAPFDSGPRALVLADLNGDGLLDIALTKSSPTYGEVDVLLNQPGAPGTFGAASDSNASAMPTDLTAVDHDRDGDLDLAVVSRNGQNVKILRNNGFGGFSNAGTWQTYQDTTFGWSAPVAVASGDMNGDGWPEIMVANEGNGWVDVLVNKGDAVGSSAHQYAVRSRVAFSGIPSAMEARDLDGDGKTDLAVASTGGFASILQTKCTGCLLIGGNANDFPYALPSGANGITVEDADGDGRLDVVTANSTSLDVSVLLNHTILPVSQDRDGNGVPDECEGDCNGNGQLDSCDIALGLLEDCNVNFLPDLCETLSPEDDCNSNGVDDLCDIAAGTALDCNGNGVPDSCDLAAGTSPDCNANGVPDECDIGFVSSESSPQLGPFVVGTPQSHTFPSPPDANLTPGLSVSLKFEANAYFWNSGSYVTVRVNGTQIGYAYLSAEWGCDSPYGPDLDELTLTPSSFNSLKAGGDVVVDMYASNMDQDCPSGSWISVTLEYNAGTSLDTNGNGIPDECEGP